MLTQRVKKHKFDKLTIVAIPKVTHHCPNQTRAGPSKICLVPSGFYLERSFRARSVPLGDESTLKQTLLGKDPSWLDGFHFRSVKNEEDEADSLGGNPSDSELCPFRR